MLSTSTSGTRLILDYLATLQRGEQPAGDHIEAIAQDPGYRRLLQRWRWLVREIRGEDDDGLEDIELVRCLRTYASGGDWTGHRQFGNLIQALGEAQNRLSYHETTYRALENLDMAGIERDVLEHLPRGAHIQADLYFLAESHPAAYVFQGDIIVSFFPLTLEGGELHTIAGPLTDVLRHELHHIGLETVSPAYEGSMQLPDTPDTAAMSVVSGLVGEGTATLFFTPVEDMSLEGADWRPTAADLPCHYESLARLLEEILEGVQCPDEGMRRAFGFLHEPYRGEHLPVVYVLGADMCRTIADAFGKRRLIDLLASPERILLTYNDAGKSLGKPLIEPRVAAAVAELGSE